MVSDRSIRSEVNVSNCFCGKGKRLAVPAVTVGVVIVDVNDVVVDDVIVDGFAAAGCGDDVGIAIGVAGAAGGDDVCPTLDDGHYYLVCSFDDLNCGMIKENNRHSIIAHYTYDIYYMQTKNNLFNRGNRKERKSCKCVRRICRKEAGEKSNATGNFPENNLIKS